MVPLPRFRLVTRALVVPGLLGLLAVAPLDDERPDFWLVLERAKRKTPGSPVPIGAACGMFLIISAGLYAAESRTKQLVEQSQEKDRLESTEKIIAATGEQARANAQTQTTQTDNAEPAPISDDANDRPWTGGFTGRYRLGPEEAQARIVIITDYQCPDCRRVEVDEQPATDPIARRLNQARQRQQWQSRCS